MIQFDALIDTTPSRCRSVVAEENTVGFGEAAFARLPRRYIQEVRARLPPLEDVFDNRTVRVIARIGGQSARGQPQRRHEREREH